jgi:hypothetical protein
LPKGCCRCPRRRCGFTGRIGYHDFEGPAIDRDECDRVVADLGRNNVLVLRNHGLLVCGNTVPQAFNAIYWLEQACRIQVERSAARALHAPTELAIGNTLTCFSGTEITLDNERDTNPVLNEAAQNLQTGYGLLEWPALRRRLDRIDGSYAQ